MLVSCSEYPRDKPFLLTMVSYLKKYETIVSRNGLFLGYSEQDTSSVRSAAQYAYSKACRLKLLYSVVGIFHNWVFVFGIP